MSGEAPAKGPGRGRLRKATWIAVAVLALVIGVAVQTGWAGFGWAHLWAAAFPRDVGLLAYLPRDTAAFAIVDPHHLELGAIGAGGGAVRSAIERTRDEVKKASGIDLAFDVDKLVLSPTVAVARGRFDGEELAKRLAEHRYTPAEHNGTRYLVRAGEDAIAVIGDEIVLYGDEAGVKAAIDANAGNTGIDEDEAVTDRLAKIGWGHALLATVRVTEDRPSLRAILTGATGPRAITLALSTKQGLDLRVAIEAASASAAAELAKLLEEKRGSADALRSVAGADLGSVLAGVAKNARIAASPGEAFVSIDVHLEPAELDALVAAAPKGLSGGALEAYKALRLFQLLTPSR